MVALRRAHRWAWYAVWLLPVLVAAFAGMAFKRENDVSLGAVEGAALVVYVLDGKAGLSPDTV